MAPSTRSLAPFIPVGMIAVVALFVVLARLPDNSALKGALTGADAGVEAASDACAVDAVGVKCRCVVRKEDECMDMQGKFYAKKNGGIDACLKVCSAAE